MKNYYLMFVNWITAYLACLTMIFSPVAMGKEAKALSQKNLQQTLKKFGLDKKLTLGEFWEKSKASMPVYIYKDLEAFVKKNKNLQMPEVVMDVSRATDGTEVPVMYFSQNGKTRTAQFYGEKEKWVKLNAVTLSALDLDRVTDAFKRIEASDIKLKKEADQYRKNQLQIQHLSSEKLKIVEYQNDFSRFNGFPRITPQMWKSLNKEQRAGYIVKMRLLWLNAKKVLATSPNADKPAKKSKEAATLENFYKIIFGQNAEANANTKSGKLTPSADVRVNGTTVKTKQGKVVYIPYDAKSCVVAGYVGAYGKVSNVNGDNRHGCSIDLAVATYKSNENLKFVQEANDSCAVEKSTQVACNPIIYGFPGGQAACIDRRSAEYQQATHFASPANRETCDGKSRLSGSEDIIKFNDKDYSAIQPREKQISAIEADQKKEDYALTQSYIKGVLSKKDPLMIKLLEKGEWNLALDEELVRIQSQFEEEITRAIKTCEGDISAKHEKNQKLACDQLHRRWLFTERAIAKLRDKACIKPALYIGNYNVTESSYADSAKEKTAINKKTIDANGTALCECPAEVSVTEANSQNNKSQNKRVNFAESCSVPPTIAKTESVTTNKAVEEVVETAVRCSKPEGIAGFNYEQCKCDNNVKLVSKSGEEGIYECEGSDLLPWALGGFALLGLVALFHDRKNPSSQQPPPPSCEAPKVGIQPSCSCPAAPSNCTLPQKIYDLSTCQCTDVAQPPICADGSPAPNGNLAQCPATSEGGGGNSCPQGGCSGGLPATGTGN